MICELLGVPYADREFFRRTAEIVSRRSSADQRVAAMKELRAYVGGLVTQKDRAPGPDLLSRLVTRYREAGTSIRRP